MNNITKLNLTPAELKLIDKLSINTAALKLIVTKDDIHSRKPIQKLVDSLYKELISGIDQNEPKLSQKHLNIVQASVDNFVSICSGSEYDTFIKRGGEKILKALETEQAKNAKRLLIILDYKSPIHSEPTIKLGNNIEIPQELLHVDKKIGEKYPVQTESNPIIDREDIKPIKKQKGRKSSFFKDTINMLGFDQYLSSELERFSTQELPLFTDDFLVSIDPNNQSLIQFFVAYNSFDSKEQTELKNKVRKVLRANILSHEEEIFFLKIQEIFDTITSTDNPIKNALKMKQQTEDKEAMLAKFNSYQHQQKVIEKLLFTDFLKTKREIRNQIVITTANIETHRKNIQNHGNFDFLIHVKGEIEPLFSSLISSLENLFDLFNNSQIKLIYLDTLSNIRNDAGDLVSITSFLLKEQELMLNNPMRFTNYLSQSDSSFNKNLNKIQESIQFKLQAKYDDIELFLANHKNTKSKTTD
ncbi:MAG: hypothetical protein WC010_00160 [Candidatus Absconditabacterales bacterium]